MSILLLSGFPARLAQTTSQSGTVKRSSRATHMNKQAKQETEKSSFSVLSALWRMITNFFAMFCSCKSDSSLQDKGVALQPIKRSTKTSKVARKILPLETLKQIKKRHAKLSNKFVGVQELKKIYRAQVARLRELASKHSNKAIREERCDSWTFPAYDPCNDQEQRYNLTSDAFVLLLQDDEFIKRFREGIQLVLLAYGWNTETNSISSGFQKIPLIRLRRILRSVQLFLDKEDPLFLSLQFYTIAAKYADKTN